MSFIFRESKSFFALCYRLVFITGDMIVFADTASIYFQEYFCR